MMIAEPAQPARGQACGRVGVGVGLSPAGLAALAWATEEAITSGARMTLCYARDHGDPPAAVPDLETLRRAQPDLVRRVEWCRQLLGGGNVTVELPLGDVPAALVELSERVDLLVLGGHDVTRRHHRARGGQVAAGARCPVVIVRPPPEHGVAPFAGHVVIGVDGSPGSSAAIRFGFGHAQRHQLPVAAVHVEDRWPGDFWFDEEHLETHFAVEPAALELLAREVGPFAAGHPRVAVKRAVFGGDAITGLRHAATGAALLVLGRHGHRPPEPPRLGPANQAFTEHADCTVAIVPERGADRRTAAGGPGEGPAGDEGPPAPYTAPVPG
ncbi:universal stress protein [Dactylosporangium sp. NPDC000244]|uniref:universal stress protein n=1 Tax=Dactylosporangium sp. NPDC000244 TaxID=3154365 RepID=UPI0033250635